MDAAQARDRFAAGGVARLATVDAAGRPHLVPVTFIVDGDEVHHAVDAKPKRSRNLKRLANIEANPNVSLLVDHYADDWTELWWVRADGVARVLPAATDVARSTLLLAAKYPQYREHPPAGPAVVVTVAAWRGWSAR